MQRSRLVFLNSLPLNAVNLSLFFVEVRRIDASKPMGIELLRYTINKAKSVNAEIISFIRHESTLNLINQLFNLQLTANQGLYQWRKGDEIIVVSLKKPVRGQETQVTSLEDLEIYYVYIDERCI